METDSKRGQFPGLYFSPWTAEEQLPTALHLFLHHLKAAHLTRFAATNCLYISLVAASDEKKAKQLQRVKLDPSLRSVVQPVSPLGRWR